ncbi:MAG TPA: PAS domain-containing protein [Armatimonadaceae bacterium]|nr:PAS domain-containing protein [Armatimonadaceae bacterium]
MADIVAREAVTDASPEAPRPRHRAQRLLDAGLVGVLYWSIDGGIEDANDTFLQMLGYTRDDLAAGRIDWIELTPPDLRARDEQPVADLHATGRHLPFEKEYVRKDGTRVPVLVASAFNEGSRTEGVGFVVDISPQKRAEREATQSRQEVEAILESIGDAFFALDDAWRFSYVNAEAERLLRRRRGELLGRDIWEEFPAAVGTEFEAQYHRALRERETVAFQAHYPPPLDSWYDVRAYPSPRGAGLSVYFRNINEERKREEERERLLAEQERLLAELREAGTRQRRFLKEMLAGFTEGRMRLCFSESELPAALPPLSDPLSLSDASLRPLRKHLAGAAEGMQIPQERLQGFVTAVHEAAVNAVKYGGGGTARVKGDVNAGVLQVWVEDQGPGIAEEMIHRSVERGYTTQGFGHGTFFMQSCSDRLYLFSETGRGTTVVLEIDRHAPEPAWLLR